MRKYATEFISFLIVLLYFFLLVIFPFETFKLGFNSEIMPAIELIIIYYFSVYRRVEVWQLFITGFAVDIFYAMPAGANSIILILANLLLRAFCKRFSLKEYTVNLLAFAAYAFFVIFIRYITKSVIDPYITGGKSIYFYFLATIFSYPVLREIIDKPLRALS